MCFYFTFSNSLRWVKVFNTRTFLMLCKKKMTFLNRLHFKWIVNSRMDSHILTSRVLQILKLNSLRTYHAKPFAFGAEWILQSELPVLRTLMLNLNLSNFHSGVNKLFKVTFISKWSHYKKKNLHIFQVRLKTQMKTTPRLQAALLLWSTFIL